MAIHEYQKQMYKKVAVIAALIILPVVGFFVGMQYQKQTGGNPTASAQTRLGANGRFGSMMRNRAIGTVKAINASSITVTSRFDNADHTYTLTGSTTYMNGSSTAQATDVHVGDTVLVTLDSTDNTKAAQVTINPTMMFRGSAGDNTQGPTDNGSGNNAVLQ